MNVEKLTFALVRMELHKVQ